VPGSEAAEKLSRFRTSGERRCIHYRVYEGKRYYSSSAAPLHVPVDTAWSGQVIAFNGSPMLSSVRYCLHVRFNRSWTICGIFLVALGLASVATSGDDPPDRNAVLGHLNAIISWYREASANAPPGEMPSDAIFQQNVRSLAVQAVQLAFQSARAQAVLLGESNEADGSGAPQDYAQLQARVSQHLTDDQSALDALNKQIPTQSGTKRKNSLAQRDELTGQIALDRAMLDAIQKMSSFVELNTVGKQGLQGSIDELANSIPEVLAPSRSGLANTQKPGQTASPTTTKSGGLVGELGTLYAQVQSMRTIDRLLAEDARVSQTASALREPLRASTRAIIAQGQQGVPQASGAAANGTASGGAKPEDFAQLTKRFNQLSAALLPLSQELLVLDESRSNLQQWRSSIASESKRDLIALLFRVFGIAIALAIVWGLSDVWRRLTFRYVHDARRRRQFLLLRRFVMGFFFAMVVVMGFVSEFSSLATYAGFVTAGVAVGLQTLLLSVAAYFFVVGRYGIRIGDRISVAGVTGDVVDVGLVRLYIMELAGTGVDIHPTGRIAVFSNSVLFQPGTPLFKQVPGTEYAWHEVAISVAPGGDHRLVHDKVLAAVNSVYDGYREVMKRQQGTIGDRMEIVLKAPEPEARFQLSDDGLSLVVRYPALLARESEIDDRMAQALIDLVNSNGAIKPAIAGTPKIRAAVKS
jgi:small-conductance mechanosensitive channel